MTDRSKMKKRGGHMFVGPVMQCRGIEGSPTGQYEFSILMTPTGNVSTLAYDNQQVAWSSRKAVLSAGNAHRIHGRKTFDALVESYQVQEVKEG